MNDRNFEIRELGDVELDSVAGGDIPIATPIIHVVSSILHLIFDDPLADVCPGKCPGD